METPTHHETTPPPSLCRAETCLKIVFPEEDRPSLRCFREWQHKRLIPFRKIGKLVMFDPVEVRRAIDRQFTVNTR
jgi:hypothetical protein